MLIIEEKGKEEIHSHSGKNVSIQPILIPLDPLPSSSNWPPYPERLVMEKNDPNPESILPSELRNIFIKVPLLQAIKYIPSYTKIIMELYIKNPGRKSVEPQTIQFVGRATELMTRCVQMEKYTNHGNPVVSIQISDVLVSNVPIELEEAINIMTKKTMD